MREAPPRKTAGGGRSRRGILPQGASLDNATERELREFLKVVRPEWSLIPRGGMGAPIDKIMAKLKDIGICEVATLLKRVRANTINMELSEAGHSIFGDDTLASMRSKASFYRALDNLGSSVQYRQTGPFAPVPQLLAKSNLFEAVTKDLDKSYVGGQASQQRPATAPNRPTRVQSELHRREEPRLEAGMSCATGALVGAGPVGGLGDTVPASFAALRPNSAPGGAARRGKPQLGTSVHAARPRSGALTLSAPRGPQAEMIKRLHRKSEHDSKFAVSGDAADEQPIPVTRPALRFTRPSSSPAMLRGGANNGSRRSKLGCANANANGDGGKGYGGDRDCMSPTAPMNGKAGELDVCSSSAGAEEDAELELLQSAGFGAPQDPWSTASWKSGKHSDLEGQVKCMIEEQRALDEKDKFFQAISREGKTSGLRRVVTENIRCRLEQETRRDAKGVADANQQCFNIRNKLADMRETTRELSSVRKKIANALEEPNKSDVFASLKSRFTIANKPNCSLLSVGA